MSSPVARSVVGLNLTWLVPGVVGGSEEYTIRLLTGIGESTDTNTEFRVYGRRDLFSTYPRLTTAPFVPVVMPGRRIPKPQRIALERTWLARASSSDAVLHHLGGTVPFVRRRGGGDQRVAVTIHDLQPVDLAHNFSTVKRTWLGRLIPFAVEHADLIVCPSRFTADRIVDRYRVDPSRLRVVQQGRLLEPEGDSERPAPELVARLGPRRYVLYPAIAYRHKRHRDLIDALGRLPGRLADIDLVFCGRLGPESARLADQASRAGLAGRVHVLGRVSETDLHWLYDNALALAFPSEYEGFGNPCLEAMARGCPVVAADGTALPEVVADAGLLVPTGDVGAWTQAIADLADHPDRVVDLARRGRERAATFDPAIASSRLWAVYRELLGVGTAAACPLDSS